MCVLVPLGRKVWSDSRRKLRECAARPKGRGYAGLSQATWVYPRILDICWTCRRGNTPNYLFYMASPTGFEPVLPP